MASTTDTGSTWVLEVVRGRDLGKRFARRAGRDPPWQCPGGRSGVRPGRPGAADSPRRMAARQAALTARGDLLEIRDLESPGGTFVNRQRLLSGHARPLQPGDVIQLGGVQLQVCREAGPASSAPDRNKHLPARLLLPHPRQRPQSSQASSHFPSRLPERAPAGHGTTS